MFSRFYYFCINFLEGAKLEYYFILTNVALNFIKPRSHQLKSDKKINYTICNIMKINKIEIQVIYIAKKNII